MNNKNENKVPIELITKKLSGEAGSKDLQSLEAWINKDDANLRLFEQYTMLWKKTGSIHQMDSIDIDIEWDHFKNKTKTRSPKTRPVSLQIVYRMAAAIIIGLLVGYSGLFIYKEVRFEKVIASSGIMEVKLPDGSNITLNAGSKIIFPKSFKRASRDIKLEGEGFFDVFSDPLRPFSVHSGDVIVEVLGTSFNVDASSDDRSVSVVVTDGKVAVYRKSEKATAQHLAVGEKAEYSGKSGQLLKSENTDVNFNSYISRKIIFNNSGLDEIIKTLTRVYNKDFRLSIPETKDYVITVTFDNKDLDYVLNTIGATLQLDFIHEGEQIIIR